MYLRFESNNVPPLRPALTLVLSAIIGVGLQHKSLVVRCDSIPPAHIKVSAGQSPGSLGYKPNR